MSRNPFASDWLRGADSDRQRPHGGWRRVGAGDDPLRFMTIAGLLDRAVARNGAATRQLRRRTCA